MSSAATTEGSWHSLFAPGGMPLRVSVITRYGHPLLVLEGDWKHCGEALDLYPAQTLLAKSARALLKAGLRCRLPLPLGREELGIDSTTPFCEFLTKQAGASRGFAMLCGNPHADGRRFTLLAGTPEKRVIIKAGTLPRARQLIAQEAEILRSLGGGSHAPRLLDFLDAETVAAFAVEFIPGSHPSSAQEKEAAAVLASWVGSEEVALQGVPAWRRLLEASPCAHFDWGRLVAHPVARTLYHGDFAPWNIKVTPRGWVVLDWERGETPGVPGWDWFHFLIQPRLLVQKMPASQIISDVEHAMAMPEFQDYAAKAKMIGIEKLLAFAYLEYMTNVMPPGENAACLQEARRIAAERWI